MRMFPVSCLLDLGRASQLPNPIFLTEREVCLVFQTNLKDPGHGFSLASREAS